MGIMDFKAIAGIHNRLMQSGKQPAFERLRGHNMITVRPAESHIFIRSINLHSMKYLFLPVTVTVLQSILITVGTVCIGYLRLEIAGISLLDLFIQSRIRRFIIPAGQEHGKHSSGF